MWRAAPGTEVDKPNHPLALIQQSASGYQNRTRPATGRAVTTTTCPCRPESLTIRICACFGSTNLAAIVGFPRVSFLIVRSRPCRWPGAGWPTCAAPPWSSQVFDGLVNALDGLFKPVGRQAPVATKRGFLNSSSCDSNLVMSRFCAFTSAIGCNCSDFIAALRNSVMMGMKNCGRYIHLGVAVEHIHDAGVAAARSRAPAATPAPRTFAALFIAVVQLFQEVFVAPSWWPSRRSRSSSQT